MKGQHLIDNAIFDTTYVGPGLAENQSSQVDEFIKNDLMPVIEEAFNQADIQLKASRSVIRMERLEVDLGEIAVLEYRRQMPEILKQRLLKALADLRPAIGDPSPGTALLDNGSTAQSPLFYFLRNGYLPWYARSDTADDPATLDTLLLESIEQRPESLLDFMRANAGRDAVLQRLVNQFSPQCLQQAMRLLSAQNGSVARQTLLQLEAMLDMDDGLGYSHSEPLRSVVSSRTAQSASAGHGRQGEHVGRLHRQLVAALLTEDSDPIESAWAVLLAGHGRLLEQTLRYYGQQVQVRRRIAVSFTATMRTELLRLLEPDVHGWLQSLLDHAELFQPRVGDARHEYEPRQSELWEFSLGFLLVERDRRFDKKAYLLSLLRQLAVSSDASETLLLSRLKQNLSAINEARESNEWSRRLARLIETIDPFDTGEALEAFDQTEAFEAFDQTEAVEVPDQAEDVEATDQTKAVEAFDQTEAFEASDQSEANGAPDQSPPVEAPAQSLDGQVMVSKQAQSYRRYERVKSALTISTGRPRIIESELLDDVKGLQHETPWLLQRLYRELQTGSYDWPRATADWPPEVLAELCYALLSLNDQAGDMRPYGVATELVVAIRQKATELADSQILFTDILGRLIKGELIDLDATPIQPEAVDLLPGQPDKAAGKTSQSALTGSFGSDTLRELADMSLRARALMLRSAELLTTAAYLVETGLSSERLDAIKWQFIRAHVTATGYLYNESFFVRRYVDHLIRQVRVSDPEQFRDSLRQGLLQNSLPATRDLTRRLIEVLSGDLDDQPRFFESGITESTGTDDEPLPLEDIYIANAGMVLLAPYLPRLFDRLGFIDTDKFKTREAAERAVHCLQYLVNSSTTSPEYQLVLNKLLCGVKPGLPIRREIELNADEHAQLDGMLKAVTQHWKALENTSIDGLRESFLQRNGRLQLKNDSWQLSVETRAFDVLLAQVPWSFSTIKFAWMERVIYVEWQ